MVVCTVDKHGVPGMPTFNIKKIRRLLKEGKARIYKHRPFTVMLLYADSLATQSVEICQDAGYEHIGISVKSEKHEFFHEQYDLLPDEKQRHDDRRKNRRNRRNRKRHRPCRPMEKGDGKGTFAPSIENKMQRHADIVKKYAAVLPAVSVTVETASFDTQLLEAIERGEKLPEGTDYQHGKRYLVETLREAVFYRDGYKCLVCGKTDVILRVHHIGFWKTPSDHTDRMGNLASVCVKCHTPKNHRKKGKLYGWEPELKPLTGAAFMNTVRWRLVSLLKETGLDVHMTYGAKTKAERHRLHISKTHANDAYCMGTFRPKHKAHESVFRKRRRNNRRLEKFYDARIIDIRDGKEKSGSDLSCNRTNRKVPRNNPLNERIYRGRKVSKGKRAIRRQHYSIRPGETVIYNGEKRTVAGVNSGGKQVVLDSVRVIPVKEARDVTGKKKTYTYKDGKCLYKDKSRKVLSYTNKEVTIYWQEGVPVDKVKRTRLLGGWIKVS